MHFDMTETQRSYVRSLQCHCYAVFAAFASRDSEPARRGARLPSHIEMREHETLTRNTNKKQIRVRMPHSTYADLYTISDSVRQRRKVSPAKCYLLNRQSTSNWKTNWGPPLFLSLSGRAGSARQQRPTGAAWRRPGTNSNSQYGDESGRLQGPLPPILIRPSGVCSDWVRPAISCCPNMVTV